MSIQLSDGRYRVIGRGFATGLAIVDGRVSESLSGPELRRLAGMMADAFACYARAKGWQIEDAKVAEAPVVSPTEKTEPLRVSLADLAARKRNSGQR